MAVSPISVNLPIYLEVDYTNAPVELFQAPDVTVSGEEIICHVALSQSALRASLQFHQPADNADVEDADKYTISGEAYSSHQADLSGAVYACLTGDVSGDLVAGTTHTASSVGDFVLGWIANEAFGHPRATAAISNDTTLRKHIDEENSTTNGGNSLTKLVVDALGANIGTNEDNSGEGIGASVAGYLLRYMIEEAPARFWSLNANNQKTGNYNLTGNDNWNEFPFAEGDTLKINVRFKNMTVTDPFSNAPRAVAVTMPTINDVDFHVRLTVSA